MGKDDGHDDGSEGSGEDTGRSCERRGGNGICDALSAGVLKRKS